MKIHSKPLFQTFKLTTDPDGEAEVLVRQAREGENIERNQLFSKTRYVQTNALETAAEQEINPSLLRRKEAYLTLGRVSGLVVVDDNGNETELFKSRESSDEGPSVRAAMTETEFNRAWNRLPPEMAREIVDFVYKVNPDWDPAGGN